MAANTFNNVAHIARRAMNVVTNNLVLVPRVNRTYESEFDNPNKVGDTINARIPSYGTVTSGKVAVPAGYTDTYVPVVLTQQNASLQFSSKEMALNLQDEGDGAEFERSVLGPQMASLINKIDADGFALYNQIQGSQGTPGTAPTDTQYFLNSLAVLADNAAPMDDQIYAYLNGWTQASMVQGLKGLFQDSSEIAKQYKKGVMGTSSGMNFMMSQNVKNHTIGTFSGTPLINGAPAEGASTVAIDGWGGATDTLKKGDILTFAGVNSVNPVSKADTGQLQQFVVTADVTAVANAMATVAISPALNSTSGPSQNVTALPADNAAVKIYGSATAYSAKVSPANLVMHRDALGFACKDLPQTTNGEDQKRVRNKELGISIRCSRWWDGRSDDLLVRLDVLYGWAVLRPGFACRVMG